MSVDISRNLWARRCAITKHFLDLDQGFSPRLCYYDYTDLPLPGKDLAMSIPYIPCQSDLNHIWDMYQAGSISFHEFELLVAELSLRYYPQRLQ